VLKALQRYAPSLAEPLSSVAIVARALARPGLGLFIYLQLLDLLTALLGFKHGASELSPLVQWFIHYNPKQGIFLAKLCVVLVTVVFYSRKPRIMRSLNCLFAGIVVWNLGVLIWGS
jgi:hypothetical protein